MFDNTTMFTTCNFLDKEKRHNFQNSHTVINILKTNKTLFFTF